MLKTGIWMVLLCLALGALAQDDWEKAAELRQAGEAAKAEKLLKDYESPAGFESLNSTDKIRFLRGLLELAHLKAMRDDTTGALSLLNWAESRTDDYQRSIACIKYGEILLDMGEFERAGAYLKNADEIINKRVTTADTGAAIGQGGQQVDTGAAWRELRDQSDVLKAEVEAEEMKVKFGATYGSYVKLRRLQQLVKRSNTPRYRKEALKVADEIIETDPASQFAAAAGYLKGEIMASRLTEQSPKKAIADTKTYLDKFVKERPDGLYRGEALMLLGKISLEIEWNAKEAEKYYTQALTYFRKAREKRDALSLYAAINDDLKNQSQPTQKPTSLDQWKRTIYHDEDPLKLYNIGNAPLWYIDDKEKNCLLYVGLLKFLYADFKEAEKLFTEAGNLDNNILSLNAEGFPNLLMRLKIACGQQFMVTDQVEQKGLSDQERLYVMMGELFYMEERFEQALSHWQMVQKSKINNTCRAIAMLGEGDCLRMLGGDRKYAVALYEKVWRDKELSKTPVKARAQYNTAWIVLQDDGDGRTLANKCFEQCARDNPNSKYAEASMFYLILNNLHDDPKYANKYFEEYQKKYPAGIYLDRIKLKINEQRERKAL